MADNPRPIPLGFFNRLVCALQKAARGEGGGVTKNVNHKTKCSLPVKEPI